jgi:DNA helicase II / ATP-dependent DNA helicase PcrA
MLDELNPEQREAATHTDGPLLIIAGAGTGKTKTLASRVAWLISQGLAPERILLLTFTRRAAAEMLARAARIAGENATSRVWGGTFHATANRLLRQHGRLVGLQPEFTVCDQEDGADLMNLIRADLHLGQGGRRFPKKNTLIAIYSRTVNSQVKLSEVVRKWFPWCLDELEGMRRLFKVYTEKKRAQNVLDYDDLLLFWRALNKSEMPARFDHVLVDEYQDTNTIQADILRALPGLDGRITVVGDDAQSIYSFRAATVRNILDFPEHFAGARVVKLEQNYRSTQPILDCSNAVMAEAQEQYEKNLYTRRGGEEKPEIVTCLDEAEQCVQVCQRILARYEEGVPLKNQAVLFRASHHSDQLEVELSRRNIPFVKYGGLKFVEAAHVKDMVALLRLMENPGDTLSWYRVLVLLNGVGPSSALRTIAALGEGGTPLQTLLKNPPEVPPAAREEFEALRQAVAHCTGAGLEGQGGGQLPPAAQIERIRKFYEPVFRRAYDNAEVRLRDLDQLEQIAAGYKSRSQFITDLTLDPPTSTQDLAGPPLLDEDFLILSTIHSAKGCEWDAVHVLHAADGAIPSDMATGNDEEIEEERRLLYVAMTRAKNRLTLYFPLRYYHSGRGFTDRHTYAQLTRFIPRKAMGLFVQTGGHTAVSLDIHPPAGSAAEAVDRNLDELWSE